MEWPCNSDREKCKYNSKILTATSLLDSSSIQVACEQALHLGDSQEVTQEQHAKGDASVRGGKDLSSPHGFATHSCVLSSLLCLPYMERLLAGYNTRKHKYWNSDQGYMIPNQVGHYYETPNLHSRETKLWCSLWPGQSLSFVSPSNLKIKQITSWKKKLLDPAKKWKMPPNPLAPFLQEPINAKNAQNCQMHLFPPTHSIMKKFFGHAHKK